MVNDMQRYMVLNKNLELDQSDKRHIIQVMKMKIGEEFEIVFDKQVFLCRITSISKKNLTYQIVSKYDIDNLKKYKVVLGVCLIKEQKMDYLLLLFLFLPFPIPPIIFYFLFPLFYIYII